MKLKQFQEQVFFSTIRITTQVDAGRGTSIGTGFLASVPIGPGVSCILLVSNRHVYGDSKERITLIFHRKDAEGNPVLGQSVRLQPEHIGNVFGHPDPSVDLACANVSLLTQAEPPIYYRSIGQELIAGFDEEDLLPGNEVWFVGYPENRFDTRHNLPLLRRGYISSIPSVDFEGRKEFVIDAHVYQGSSGSPVFTASGGVYKLIGVVSQTMIRHEHLQVVAAVTGIAVQQTIGLGIVLKSTLLRPLFDAATAGARARYLKEDAADAGTVPRSQDGSQV